MTSGAAEKRKAPLHMKGVVLREEDPREFCALAGRKKARKTPLAKGTLALADGENREILVHFRTWRTPR